MNEDKNELKLLEGLWNRDEAAFQRFFMTNFQRIEAFVRCYIKDEDDAQSVISDTFLKFWQQTPGNIRFETISGAVGYLFRTAFHESLNQIRSKKQKPKVIELRGEDVNEMPNPDLLAWETEMYMLISEAIKALPEKLRPVAQGIYKEHKSIMQVARELGIGYDAAQKRKIRAEQLIIHKVQKWTKFVILVKVVLLTIIILWKELSHL